MVTTDLVRARMERWWRTTPPLKTLQDAQDYIEDVGFSLLFGGAAARYPSLREASRDESLPRDSSGWGADIEAMWTWKDTLPVLGKAWLGRYLSGKQTLLAPDLLADLYEFDGAEDDAVSASGLSAEAFAVASALLDIGPASKRAVRARLGMSGKEIDQPVAELGRRLLITHYGIEEGPGWAACVWELTSRAFTVSPQGDRADRDARAAQQFMDTMITAKPADLCRAFGWSRERAVRAFAALPC